MKYLIVLLMFLCSGCSYNISMAHTEGVAEDVIDDTATNQPNISPNIGYPLINHGPMKSIKKVKKL